MQGDQHGMLSGRGTQKQQQKTDGAPDPQGYKDYGDEGHLSVSHGSVCIRRPCPGQEGAVLWQGSVLQGEQDFTTIFKAFKTIASGNKD